MKLETFLYHDWSRAVNAPAAENSLEQLVYREQVSLLYRNAPVGLFIALLGGGILVFVLSAQLPWFPLLAWYACLAIVTLGRWWLAHTYHRNIVPESQLPIWESRFLLGTALAGLTWGSTTTFAFPGDVTRYQFFVVFVLAGMTAGAIAAYPSRIRVFLGFMIPILAPVVVRFLLIPGSFYQAMALLTAVFAVGITLAAWNTCQAIQNALILRIDRQELVAEMAKQEQIANVLRQNERRFRSLVEQAPLGVVQYRPNGSVVVGNDAARMLYRPPEGMAQCLLQDYNVLQDKQLQAKGVMPSLKRIFAGEKVWLPPVEHSSHWATRKGMNMEGDVQACQDNIWIESVFYPVTNETGDLLEVVGLHQDITQRKQSEQALQRRLDLKTTVASLLSQFATTTDLDEAIDTTLAGIGRLSGANRAYLFRISAKNGTMANTHEWCAEGVESQIARLQGLPSETFPWSMAQLRQGEALYIPDMSELPEEAQAEKAILQKQGVQSLLFFPVCVGGVLSGLLGLDNVQLVGAWHEEDHTLLRLMSEMLGNALERQQSTKRLEELATHDSLTHLPNRRLLEDRLEHALLQARRHCQWVGIVYLDLDNFKEINDRLGHDSGDKVLQLVAQRLTDSVRASDTVSRFGGDEFVILLEDITCRADVQRVVEKIGASISVPYQVAGSEIIVTLSIGVSNYPEDGVDSSELLRCADMAMYHAKSSGKNQYQFYSPPG